jgi:hypothetical protein
MGEIDHWNYRIIQVDRDLDWYELREVYYDKDRKIVSQTTGPVEIAADSPEEIIELLEQMLLDAKKNQVLR